MELDVFFAGTAGSAPTPRRGLPALLIRRGGDRLLFDCGEGTQRQLVRSIGLPDIHDVFLTHFHVDHWLGLPGLLKTFDLRGREVPLALHGPPGLGELMRLLRPVVGRVSYPLQAVELAAGDTAPCESLVVAAHDADLLVHEATFVEEERERAAQTDHATAAQAAEAGRDAGVRMLALTHLSTRYGGGEVRDEARAIFPNTVVP